MQRLLYVTGSINAALREAKIQKPLFSISAAINEKALVLLAALCCAVLVCAMLTGRFLYFSPVGYIQLCYGDGGTAAVVELAYSRFSRIVDYRPLTAPAVNPLAGIAIRHTSIPEGYEELIKTFSRSPALIGQSTVRVHIAQDDLARAKAVEKDLSLLSEPLMAATGRRLSVIFELYTLELYRAAGENTQNGPAMHGDGHRHMMMNRWGRR